MVPGVRGQFSLLSAVSYNIRTARVAHIIPSKDSAFEMVAADGEVVYLTGRFLS